MSEARQFARISRAIDTNQIICVPCNKRWFDYSDAHFMGESGWDGARLAVCERADFIECQGACSVLQITHGVREGKRRLLRMRHPTSTHDGPAAGGLSDIAISDAAEAKADELADVQRLIDAIWSDEIVPLGIATAKAQATLDTSGLAQYYVYFAALELIRRRNYDSIGQTGQTVAAIKRTLDGIEEIIRQRFDEREDETGVPAWDNRDSNARNA